MIDHLVTVHWAEREGARPPEEVVAPPLLVIKVEQERKVVYILPLGSLADECRAADQLITA